MAALANLGLNLVFVPRFGILAAAGTTLLAYLLATAITLWFSSREMTFPVYWMAILKSLVASGVMAGVILLMNPPRTWEVFLVIVLGAIVYGLALFLLKGLAKDEIRFLCGVVKRNLPLVNRRG